MDFILLTVGLLGVLVLIMVGLARAFQNNSVADFLDWKPTRAPDVEAQNEVDDVQQMIDAQNEYRRKRGAKEITEADVQRQAMEDQAMRARGRGPFAQGAGVDDQADEPAPRSAKSGAKKPAARRSATKKKPSPKR